MNKEDMSKFENDAAKSLQEVGGETSVKESKLLSGEILGILYKNSISHAEVTYSSGEHSYTVKFGFAEVKLDDGNLGFFDEIPEDVNPEDAETVSFLVTGFHKSEPTEVQFTEDKISLNKHRLHKHLVEFQRAVVKTGVL